MQGALELLIRAMHCVEEPCRAKILVEREMMKIVLKIGWQPRGVVTGVRANRSELQQQESEGGL